MRVLERPRPVHRFFCLGHPGVNPPTRYSRENIRRAMLCRACSEAGSDFTAAGGWEQFDRASSRRASQRTREWPSQPASDPIPAAESSAAHRIPSTTACCSHQPQRLSRYHANTSRNIGLLRAKPRGPATGSPFRRQTAVSIPRRQKKGRSHPLLAASVGRRGSALPNRHPGSCVNALSALGGCP